MNHNIPFLHPMLPRRDALAPYIDRIDRSGLYSNFGPLNNELEKSIVKKLFGGIGATLTNCNGTVGLMLAIQQVKRPSGRYALMPSFTFAATPLAAMWAGLTPLFIDIRPDEWCMDENLVQRCLDKIGDEVSVVVPYTVLGSFTDLSYYEKLHLNGVPVVVDAAPSLGTRLNGKQVGAEFPGLVMFSLHATKPFGIGEGGLLYSGDAELIAQMKKASNFGFNENRSATGMGYNAKLSEYGAAIGLAVLETFEDKLNNLKDLYDLYILLLDQSGLTKRGWSVHAARGEVAHQHLPVLIPDECCPLRVAAKLAGFGIQARHYFNPACHGQSAFKEFPHDSLAVTDAISARILSLPLWQGMTPDMVERVVAGLMEC